MKYEAFGQPSAGSNLKRDVRKSTLLVVKCSKSDGASFELRVRNLSAEGLGGVCLGKTRLAPGETITVNFPNVLPINGRVAWFKGGEVGLAFDQHIALETITAARNLTGSAFTPCAMHVVDESCWRPGFGFNQRV